MKKKIEEIRAKIDAFIADFTLFKLLTLIFTGALILLLITLFIFACRLVAGFVVANYELLLLCGSIVVAVIYIIWCKRVNNETTQAVQMRYQTKIDKEQEKQKYEDAYLRIQQLLFLAINDTAIVTKIPQLKSVTALDAPIHFVFTDGGFYVFQYLVAKDSATTSNIIQMKEILNNRIRQALNSGEIMGKYEMHLSHNSIPYQKILIHDIRDNGSFLQINAVIVGHPYTDYIERGKVVSETITDNSDLDF